MNETEMRFALAEKVMGWKVHKFDEEHMVIYGMDQDGDAIAFTINPEDDDFLYWFTPWKYVNHAADVLNRIRQCGFRVKLYGDENDLWSCSIHETDQHNTRLVEHIDKSLPMAICKAALKLAGKYTLTPVEESDA